MYLDYIPLSPVFSFKIYKNYEDFPYKDNNYFKKYFEEQKGVVIEGQLEGYFVDGEYYEDIPPGKYASLEGNILKLIWGYEDDELICNFSNISLLDLSKLQNNTDFFVNFTNNNTKEYFKKYHNEIKKELRYLDDINPVIQEIFEMYEYLVFPNFSDVYFKNESIENKQIYAHFLEKIELPFWFARGNSDFIFRGERNSDIPLYPKTGLFIDDLIFFGYDIKEKIYYEKIKRKDLDNLMYFFSEYEKGRILHPNIKLVYDSVNAATSQYVFSRILPIYLNLKKYTNTVYVTRNIIGIEERDRYLGSLFGLNFKEKLESDYIETQRLYLYPRSIDGKIFYTVYEYSYTLPKVLKTYSYKK